MAHGKQMIKAQKSSLHVFTYHQKKEILSGQITHREVRIVTLTKVKRMSDRHSDELGE